jgi:hypothetical protein
LPPPSSTTQTINGVVSGSIVDATGLPVAGAAVSLQNTASFLRTDASSEASGEFVFLSVQPGTYSLIVEAKGFKRFEKSPVIVTASERVAAGTLQLQVGAVTETVTVSGESLPCKPPATNAPP